jgi:hypothetical protein
MRRCEALDLELPPEAAHRDLERLRAAICSQYDGFAVENQLSGRHRPGNRHDLGDGNGHIAQVS